MHDSITSRGQRIEIAGDLRASHGELTIDAARLDDLLADALQLDRQQYGAIADDHIGRVTLTLDVRPRTR